MKNQKLYALAGMLIVFALAFSLSACSSKGKLAIAGIGAEYKGSYIIGFEDSGDYFFAASASTLEDIKGAAIKGTSVTLNVYETDTEVGTFVPFFGEATILRGNLMIVMMENENFPDFSIVHEFINSKVVSFENGSAKINLATDFELFD